MTDTIMMRTQYQCRRRVITYQADRLRHSLETHPYYINGDAHGPFNLRCLQQLNWCSPASGHGHSAHDGGRRSSIGRSFSRKGALRSAGEPLSFCLNSRG
jgi:hypothetical protein